jgi:TonB family protein
VLVWLALTARTAAAQTTASNASTRDVEAPTPMDAGHVAYPQGEHLDATVVLEVVVDKEGRVSDVLVVDGEPPFSSAALEAARAWTFTPARRAGTPVSARIRMRIDFHAPAPAPPSLRRGPPSTPPASSAAPPYAEVQVHGVRTEVGQTQMGGAEVRQLPGAFGDAFRAIEALPGVTPIVSGLPFFFVRGAPPGNVGYFLDGVRVPLLYHLALGPSVVHPALIDRVDFYPGGYPARFGRFAGGILDGETLPPASRAHAEGNVRLFDAGALGEAPLLDGRMTALVAGRYGYPAALVQLFAKDTRVGYWDYQTRASYELTPRDRISLFWFGSFDEIDNRNRTEVFDGKNFTETVGDFYPIFKTEFHRLDLRYDHDTPHGHVRLAATFGVEDSLTASSKTQFDRVTAINFGLRSEGDERLNAAIKLRYGADVILSNYSLDTGQNADLDIHSLYPSRNDVTIGTYADAIWRASRRVEVVPGLRLDVFTSRRAPSAAPASQFSTPGTFGAVPGELSSATASVGVEPRLATRVAATSAVTWITTFGVANQPPSFFVPIPGLTLGRLNSGLQTALQMSQGAELALPLDIRLTATLFLHDYLGLTDATATCVVGGTVTSSNDCFAEKTRGRAYGIELLAHRDLTKRLSGWISYTLSRSTRETRGLVLNIPSSAGAGPAPSGTLQEIAAEFDRTHVLNVVGALDLGRGWRAGARAVLYTGRPYSPQVHGVSLPPYNSLRLPPFYRFDVRLEKRWRAFGNGYLAFVAEGLNVTLTKEAISVQCQNDGTLFPLKYDTCDPQYIGPVTVPSVGVEGAM